MSTRRSDSIALTVDIAVFAPKTGAPTKILLIKRKNPPFQGMWAFPGGFVDVGESLAEAAKRELLKETGVSAPHLSQVCTAGDPGRDPRQHVVSVCFLARVSEIICFSAADDAAEAKWFVLGDLPQLAFDHRQILDLALEKQNIRFCYEHPHPAVTTDVVIFSIREERLNVLLIERNVDPHRGKWALPGGFVLPEERLEECAKRELQEETGVSDVFLEQLFSFGDPDRDPRERVITVAYYALIPSDKIALTPSTDADAAMWVPVEELSSLAFDHIIILELARERLKAKLAYSNIVLQFLPAAFTLSEVQGIYEIVLGSSVDKRNFRKWLDANCRLQETGKFRRGGTHRPAKLYRSKDRKRFKLLK